MPDTVYHIIHRWFDGNRDDPWEDVVQAAAQEAETRGLTENCATLVRYEGAFHDIAVRWQHFQRSDALQGIARRVRTGHPVA